MSLSTNDPHGLERFVQAQAGVYEQVRRELAAGEKRSHWMWFIFPQVRGLGSSPMAQRYAVSGLAEARAYLAHPVLGPRLRECTELVLASGRSVAAVFPYPDDLKFHSSVTLFTEAAGEPDSVFQRALASLLGGQPDRATLARLG